MLDFNNCFYLYRSNYELSIVDNFRIIDDKQIELNIKHADNSFSNEIVDKSFITSFLKAPDEKELNDLINNRDIAIVERKFYCIAKNNEICLDIQNVIDGINQSIYGYCLTDGDFNEDRALMYYYVIKNFIEFNVIKVDTKVSFEALPSKKDCILAILEGFYDYICYTNKSELMLKDLEQMTKAYLKAKKITYARALCNDFAKLHFVKNFNKLSECSNSQRELYKDVAFYLAKKGYKSAMKICINGLFYEEKWCGSDDRRLFRLLHNSLYSCKREMRENNGECTDSMFSEYYVLLSKVYLRNSKDTNDYKDMAKCILNEAIQMGFDTAKIYLKEIEDKEKADIQNKAFSDKNIYSYITVNDITCEEIAKKEFLEGKFDNAFALLMLRESEYYENIARRANLSFGFYQCMYFSAQSCMIALRALLYKMQNNEEKKDRALFDSILSILKKLMKVRDFDEPKYRIIENSRGFYYLLKYSLFKNDYMKLVVNGDCITVTRYNADGQKLPVFITCKKCWYFGFEDSLVLNIKNKNANKNLLEKKEIIFDEVHSDYLSYKGEKVCSIENLKFEYIPPYQIDFSKGYETMKENCLPFDETVRKDLGSQIDGKDRKTADALNKAYTVIEKEKNSSWKIKEYYLHKKDGKSYFSSKNGSLFNNGRALQTKGTQTGLEFSKDEFEKLPNLDEDTLSILLACPTEKMIDDFLSHEYLLTQTMYADIESIISSFVYLHKIDKKHRCEYKKIIKFYDANAMFCFPEKLEEQFRDDGVSTYDLVEEFLFLIDQDDLSLCSSFVEKLELIKDGKNFSAIESKKYTLSQKLKRIREIADEEPMFASSLSKEADRNLIRAFLKEIEHTNPEDYKYFKNSEMNEIYEVI